jgi:hypothetical protein
VAALNQNVHVIQRRKNSRIKRKLASPMLRKGIMHRQHTITMHKPWSHTSSFALQLHKIVSKLRHAIEIPIGYQDETGFHYGNEPVKKETNWPQR